MVFVYQYKTSDGERHDGKICVASREDVFIKLKKQGIKPYGVELAPGLVNRIAALGKRVYAIAVLTVLLVITFGVVIAQRRIVREVVDAASKAEERRTQIYGDPLVLQMCESKGWSNVFDSPLEQVLAAYAIPAKEVNASVVRELVAKVALPIDLRPVRIEMTDSAEVAKMKRMVNWMKRELESYLEAGGTWIGYTERLQARLAEERRILARIETELSGLERNEEFESQWESKNKILRGMGMRPVPMPDEKDF